MSRKSVWIGVLLCVIAIPGYAAPITFSSSSGTLAASAIFDIVGGNLQVTLTNTSSSDTLVPADVLTAIFFDIAGNPALTTSNIALGSGSSVYKNGAVLSGASLAGQWVYNPALSGGLNGATQGISGVGFGQFGPNPPNQFFLPPGIGNAPDGLAYGILSHGDNPSTYNGGIADRALIWYSVVFSLSDLPANFNPANDISNVSFQYGTSLTEPNTQVPEAGALLLFGTGLIGLVGYRRVRRMQ